jgi:ABC-type antimicrobial peptide transport system permease subunit
MPAVRAAIKSIDAAVPLTQPLTGEQVLSAALWAPRMTATLVSTFGVLALLLATIGLYGMTAYTVAQSRQEIGLRLALGATPRAILRMVVGRGVVLACTGAALGIAAGLTAAGAVSSLLYDIDPHDPIAFVVAPVGLVAVAVIACAWPARRASRVDPTVTLRG